MMLLPMISRRTKTIERKAINNVILAVLGGIIILILVIVFGMQLLINLSLGLEKIRGDNTSNVSANTTPAYIEPPILSPMQDATNSAQIAVSGTAGKNLTVSLFLNGRIVDKVKAKD